MPVIQRAENERHTMHGAVFTTLASPSRGTRQTSVWRVEIQPGTPATPHQVTQEEILVVTGGRARVRIGADEETAAAGDCIVVPADTTFALAVDGPEPLSALVCFPAGGRARLPDGAEFTPPWAQ